MKTVILEPITADTYVKKVGIAIFVHYRLPFSNTDIAQHCKEQDVEIRAFKLLYGTLNICILTLYWPPSGNFSTFLHKLDTILQSLYSPILHFIICGDVNINYLLGSAHKHQLDNLLLSYNLYNIINLTTRVQNTSATAIDNIFIDVSQFESYTVNSIINGVSDHDAQLLIINTDYSLAPTHTLKTITKINTYTMSDFIDKLNYESWDIIFNNEDVNTTFNSFLDTYFWGSPIPASL